MPNRPLIVVSGFPRTGTSTMMRMLHLGGIEVIADPGHMNGRHEFDPYGDFELVDKELDSFKERTPDSTAGKAVKLIAPLVPKLCPTDRDIRVIFMLRDPNEIVAALLAMRVVWEWTPQEAVAYARNFFTHHDIPVKYIQYADMLGYPRTTALTVSDWLSMDAKGDTIIKMASAVDKNARTKIEGDGGQKRLVTYQFDRALVNDRVEIDLRKGESK